MFLSTSMWYLRLIQVIQIYRRSWHMELELGASTTHLPQPLLQVLNRLCPDCSLLHTDIVLHLLSEHCGSLNSLNQGQQCERSPDGGRRDQVGGFYMQAARKQHQICSSKGWAYTHENYVYCPETEGLRVSSSCSELVWHTHPSLFLQISELWLQKSPESQLSSSAALIYRNIHKRIQHNLATLSSNKYI